MKSITKEFGIDKNVISEPWNIFQKSGKIVGKIGCGHQRKIKVTDGLYITLQAKKYQQLLTALGIHVSEFTVAMRLYKCGIYALNPERFIPLTATH